MIFLLYVFCCNIMHTTVEGAESILTEEDIKILTDDCHIIHDVEDAKDRRKCISKAKAKKINEKRAKQEAQQMKDDMGISSPGGECPEITSFYTLFAKAHCVADNIRKGAQNV